MEAQAIVDTAADPMLVLDESLRVQSASRSFFQTFRVDRYETIGKHIYELGDGQWDIPELRRLLAEVIPKSTAIVNYQVEHDFPGVGSRVMLLTARTLYHLDGAGQTMLLTFVDATDRLRREAAKDLLAGELKHRMKNLMAVAETLARHTTTKGRSAEEYRDDFLGRFNALIEAQNFAFSEHEDTGLGALIERVLAPYRPSPEAITIESGGIVALPSRNIMDLSLVLHELGTNAAKYGALSVAGGRLRVGWQVENDGSRLRIKWVESGGPPVSPPARTGYGTELIQSATSYGLGGHVEQKYHPAGLEVEIVVAVEGRPEPG